MTCITLLTDFGLQDGYVGAMHGVIKSICPQASIIDLTHQVPPGDIDAGAFLLETHSRYFPAGTVHVAVIDPGVGSKRRILIAKTEKYAYIAPDNGLLSFLADAPGVRFRAATERSFWLPQVSSTFHGRDIFSPLAAHLAKGVPVDKLGPSVRRIQRRAPAEAAIFGDRIEGKILYVDRFGNLISNIRAGEIAEHFHEPVVRFGQTDLGRLAESYAARQPGEPLAIIGSFGRLEIAVNAGRAADYFQNYDELSLSVVEYYEGKEMHAGT